MRINLVLAARLIAVAAPVNAASLMRS